ncbi:MAG TPA: polysaccharide pyruvyl transferase family protein [Vicinamibacteria bacterium]
MKVLVAGWFSFEQMGATAGDILARDVVCRWLEEGGVSHDVATAPPFAQGVDWRSVEARQYSHVLFVCGPFGNGWPITDFLARFAGRRFVGVDLSMLQSLDEWNPFHLLLERDSSRAARPDLVFLSTRPAVPVVGLVRVHPQKEYQERSAHGAADELLDQVLATREVAVVSIDTRLDRNETGLRTAAEVESLIARVDVVLTTRLHGLVLAVKNGVPAVAVDPIRGGAKILRQARTLGWPHAYPVDEATPAGLGEAFERCLRPEARAEAVAIAARARERLADVRDAVLDELRRPPAGA